MPRYQESLKVEIDSETAMSIACETFLKLGWPMEYVIDSKIIGTTSNKDSKSKQQISYYNFNNELTIISEMVSGESFDIAGRNKKNVTAFITEYKNQQQLSSPEIVEKNKAYLMELRNKTMEAIAEQEKEEAAINEAMKPNGSNLYATYAIIAVNIIVFILMVLDGAGLIDPNGLVHMKWGSNYTPLTLSGDWWRLITSTFIHFGIIHLLMNMYCLYTIGIYLEPMLGKIKYLTAYLCTGVIASVVSLWWHSKEGANSAGASGAVFGMYGLFLALLTSNLIPKSVRDTLLKSIGLFIFYNLAFGMKGGVDNSAHIGGLVSGFVFGYLFVIAIKKEKEGLKTAWILPIIILVTIGSSFFYLQKNEASQSARKEILSELSEIKYKDNDLFDKKLETFIKYEEDAINVINDSTLSNESKKIKIENIAIPLWEKSDSLFSSIDKMDLGEVRMKKGKALLSYIKLRKEEAFAFINILSGKPNAQVQFDSLENKINQIANQLK